MVRLASLSFRLDYRLLAARGVVAKNLDVVDSPHRVPINVNGRYELVALTSRLVGNSESAKDPTPDLLSIRTPEVTVSIRCVPHPAFLRHADRLDSVECFASRSIEADEVFSRLLAVSGEMQHTLADPVRVSGPAHLPLSLDNSASSKAVAAELTAVFM